MRARGDERFSYQLGVFAVSLALVLLHLWPMIVFPQDDHRYIQLAFFGMLAVLPPAIWWRRSAGTVAGRLAETVVAIIAVVFGSVLLAIMVAWIAWLLAHPHSGPMSAEAMLLDLAIAIVWIVGALALIVAPFFLDPTFLTLRSRFLVRRFLMVALSVLTLASIVIGPSLNALFA